MKRILFISCAFLLLVAMPADAQIFRRPVVHRFFASPVVHDLFNFAVSQVLPNLPVRPLDSANTNADASRIFVDSSVSRSLDVIEQNLDDAQKNIDAMLKKHNLPDSQPTEKKDRKLKPRL